VSGIIGRYLYPTINRWVAIEEGEGSPIELDRSGIVPVPRRGSDTTTREFVGAITVVSIGCLMSFSSGTSNIANAIAPLVGADALAVNPLILLGCGAVAVGAFTIARRTLDTLGNDITDLPLTAAIVVAIVSSTIVVGLSVIGIPASFVIIATMSIVGLGWGRATRTATVSQSVRGEAEPNVSVGALTAEEPGEQAPEIGEEDPEDIPSAADLFDPETTGRVLLMQNVVPAISTAGAYVTFWILFEFVWV
jgi:PiT family inorganic phosphate transporter